jgi:hypothetical protein
MFLTLCGEKESGSGHPTCWDIPDEGAEGIRNGSEVECVILGHMWTVLHHRLDALQVLKKKFTFSHLFFLIKI